MTYHRTVEAACEAIRAEAEADILDGFNPECMDFDDMAQRHLPAWPYHRPELLWEWYRADDCLETYGASPETDAEIWHAARPWRMLQHLSGCETLPAFYPQGEHWYSNRFPDRFIESLSNALYNGYHDCLRMAAIYAVEDAIQERGVAQ